HSHAIARFRHDPAWSGHAAAVYRRRQRPRDRGMAGHALSQPAAVERIGTMASSTPLVEMKNISIAFGGIHAVDNASVDLHAGEVVALLGHNGAGKSTLIKILSGAYKRDEGTIFVNGEEAQISNPRDA